MKKSVIIEYKGIILRIKEKCKLMKKIKRLTAVCLSLCMLFSNVNVAFSEMEVNSISETASETEMKSEETLVEEAVPTSDAGTNDEESVLKEAAEIVKPEEPVTPEPPAETGEPVTAESSAETEEPATEELAAETEEPVTAETPAAAEETDSAKDEEMTLNHETASDSETVPETEINSETENLPETGNFIVTDELDAGRELASSGEGFTLQDTGDIEPVNEVIIVETKNPTYRGTAYNADDFLTDESKSKLAAYGYKARLDREARNAGDYTLTVLLDDKAENQYVGLNNDGTYQVKVNKAAAELEIVLYSDTIARKSEDNYNQYDISGLLKAVYAVFRSPDGSVVEKESLPHYNYSYSAKPTIKGDTFNFNVYANYNIDFDNFILEQSASAACSVKIESYALNIGAWKTSTYDGSEVPILTYLKVDYYEGVPGTPSGTPNLRFTVKDESGKVLQTMDLLYNKEVSPADTPKVKAVGKYTLQIELFAPDNSSTPFTTRTCEAEITKRPLSIRFGEGGTSVYDGETHDIHNFYPEAEIKLENTVEGETIKLISDKTSSANAGKYTLQLALDGVHSSNYTLEDNSLAAEVEILPASRTSDDVLQSLGLNEKLAFDYDGVERDGEAVLEKLGVQDLGTDAIWTMSPSLNDGTVVNAGSYTLRLKAVIRDSMHGNVNFGTDAAGEPLNEIDIEVSFEINKVPGYFHITDIDAPNFWKGTRPDVSELIVVDVYMTPDTTDSNLNVRTVLNSEDYTLAWDEAVPEGTAFMNQTNYQVDFRLSKSGFDKLSVNFVIDNNFSVSTNVISGMYLAQLQATNMTINTSYSGNEKNAKDYINEVRLYFGKTADSKYSKHYGKEYFNAEFMGGSAVNAGEYMISMTPVEKLQEQYPEYAILPGTDRFWIGYAPAFITPASDKVYGEDDPYGYSLSTGGEVDLTEEAMKAIDGLSVSFTRIPGEDVGCYAYDSLTIGDQNYKIVDFGSDFPFTEGEIIYGNFFYILDSEASLTIQKAPAATYFYAGYTYDGQPHSAIDFVKELKLNDAGLISGTDYVIEFCNWNSTLDQVNQSNVTEPGSYGVKITILNDNLFKNHYLYENEQDANVIYSSVTMLKAPAVIDISEMPTEFTYNGELQTVTGAKLNHSECELVYSDNSFITVDEGNGKFITISAEETDHYLPASVEVTLTVKPAGPVTFKVNDSSKIYGDSDPEIAVTLTNMLLAGKLDYRIERKNGENVGEYSYHVTPGSNPNYGVDWQTGTLNIKPRDIADKEVEISAIADQLYSGSAVSPKPDVMFRNEQLTEGEDYTLNYSDNIEPGRAGIVITGKGNFTGSCRIEFNILSPVEEDKNPSKDNSDEDRGENIKPLKNETGENSDEQKNPEIDGAAEIADMLMVTEENPYNLYIVFDEEYLPEDYEMLEVFIEDVLQGNSMLISAHPNENGITEQRSLILYASQLANMAEKQEIERLIFENGKAIAELDLADLLEGNVRKLMAAIVNDETITPEILKLNWDEVKLSDLKDENLNAFRIEVRIIPVETENELTAYEISVWLHWEDQMLNISEMIPSLNVSLTVDDFVTEENFDGFTSLYSISYRAADEEEADNDLDDFTVLNSRLLLIPDKLPEHQDDIVRYFCVRVSDDEDVKHSIVYDANVLLVPYRHYVLTAEYAGEGIYTIQSIQL